MSNKFGNSFLWHEKYSPQTVEDTILPRPLKAEFLKIVEVGDFSHLLFSGTAGIGKTTLAKALCKQLGMDSMFINASVENGIDTLRTKIMEFASTVSLMGTTKVVILDEGDGLGDNVQKALRGFMDEFQVRFILTCNFPHRLIDPLKGRFTHIAFDIPESENTYMMKTMFNRCAKILELEGIEFEVEPLKAVIRSNFPNFRKTLIQLQRYSSSGKIDVGILGTSPDAMFDSLITILRAKKYPELRNWVSENIHMEKNKLIADLYKRCDEFIKPNSIPQLVMTVADYDYKATFAVNQEINSLAMLQDIMGSCEFKA